MKLLLMVALIAVSLVASAQPGPNTPIRLTDSIRCTSVKNQSQSPTCWVFGSNSLFESDILKISGHRLNLSEMFIARHAYLDKAEMYLRSGGKTYFAGGGQFRDVLRVIDRYGIVPDDQYNGLPNGPGSHDHTLLDSSMKRYVDHILQSGQSSLTKEQLADLNDTLDKYLGKQPESFWFDLTNHTPLSFAKKMLPRSTEYIELMSFSNLPYFQKHLLVDKYNWSGDSIYNIPLPELKAIVDTALKKGWSVGWEGDVTNEGFNSLRGIASTTLNYHNPDSIRLIYYANETTERDHMLHIVGKGKDEYNQEWYYMKNSWGTWLNDLKGFLFMDQNYFRLNTVIIMLNKAGLPDAIRSKLGLQ